MVSAVLANSTVVVVEVAVVVDMVVVPEDPVEALVESPVADYPVEAMEVDHHPCPLVLSVVATNHHYCQDHHLHQVVLVAEMSTPIHLRSWICHPIVKLGNL